VNLPTYCQQNKKNFFTETKNQLSTSALNQRKPRVLFPKDYKAKMFQSKVGWGWGKFAEGLEIFSVSQDSHLGENRRGGTSVFIRCCYSKGVKRRLWPKHQLIYTIVPPCTPWLAPLVQQTKTRKMSSLRKVATSLL
jgi:hypothetical protein